MYILLYKKYLNQKNYVFKNKIYILYKKKPMNLILNIISSKLFINNRINNYYFYKKKFNKKNNLILICYFIVLITFMF